MVVFGAADARLAPRNGRGWGGDSTTAPGPRRRGHVDAHLARAVATGTRGHSCRLAVMIALGGVSDGLDGVLARRDGRTRLGRDLDTFADLFFLQSATRGAACRPAWPAGCSRGRNTPRGGRGVSPRGRACPRAAPCDPRAAIGGSTALRRSHAGRGWPRAFRDGLAHRRLPDAADLSRSPISRPTSPSASICLELMPP